MINRTIYREKKYVCGEYLDVYVYPVYPVKNAQSQKRGRRRKESRKVQKKLNQRHSQEKLVRLLNANFTPEDLSLTLTYRENPKTDEEAKKLLRNYLQRLKYHRKKQGLEPLKYIAVTEKSKKGRYHHHLVINGGMSRDEVEAVWGLGYANSKRLQFDENGLTALGRYITKEPLFYKRWQASQNLIDPPPTTNDSRIVSRRRAEALADMDWKLWNELYPEYDLGDLNSFHYDDTGAVYLFARMHRKDGVFIKPKRKKGVQKHERKSAEHGNTGQL